MQIQIPDKIAQALVDAIVIQNSGSIGSSELRSSHSQRLQNHVIEYITALVLKEMQNRKYITQSKNAPP